MSIIDHAIDQIKEYHAHLYYDEKRLPMAQALREHVHTKFGVFVGTLHQRNVGPHLTWSCQITVPKEMFGTIIPWLSLNRGDVDVFVHADTGDDFLDHTAHVMWLGRSYDLNKGIFKTGPQ